VPALLVGLLASAAEKMRAAAGISDGSELTEDADEGVAAMVMEECRALAASDDLPVAGKSNTGGGGGGGGSRRRRSGSAGAGSYEDDEDDEEEEEEEEAPAPRPLEVAKRASKTAAKSKLVAQEADDDDSSVAPVAAKTTTRSTRATRAALKENVAR
jgi:hypothetical protein